MAEIDQAAIEALQDQLKVISDETEKVELELANKRAELLTPIFEKRRKVIAEIPNFWPTLFKLNDGTSQMLEEDDIPVIEHLTDLWVKHDPKDVRNYEIIFTFSENPYFTNKELIKKVVLKDDEQTAEEFKINWKEGKDVTKNSKRKKDADESSDSFFSWFADEDASLADYIAHQLFSEALHLYMNGGQDDDFELDSDDAGSVDLDDEDEDEDEDDDEEEGPKKKKSKK
ncbi:hypothetical protein BGX29_006293 [Mortierella sp. GBA35]|nr:hypothetical protein BGX23_009894 [Mortierella sp. AD031]KAF9100745.1 hypothetical protein BGX29_006293 [Mortierella sp. GBA35]KAG0208229.1 hypothetical protein BGX33_006370 [Mortierella sp. NVP41]